MDNCLHIHGLHIHASAQNLAERLMRCSGLLLYQEDILFS